MTQKTTFYHAGCPAGSGARYQHGIAPRRTVFSRKTAQLASRRIRIATVAHIYAPDSMPMSFYPGVTLASVKEAA